MRNRVIRRRIRQAALVFLAVTNASRVLAQMGHSQRTANIVITVADNASGLPRLEVCELPGNRRVALTTSWDDGPPGDLQMADTLSRNGWKGTFAWNLTSTGITNAAAILAAGGEICSHTATHPWLPARTKGDIFWELLSSKIYLSVLTQRPVITYVDAFLAHDDWIDQEIGQAGFLVGRNGTTFDSYSVSDASRSRSLPSYMLFLGTNFYCDRLRSLYAETDRGVVQDMWGHVGYAEDPPDYWDQLAGILKGYGHRSDTWYPTWAEVGSQMLLRQAARLGPPQFGSNTVNYVLQMEPLPRDVLAIPLTLRIVGRHELLAEILSVTVDGTTVATCQTNGALLFEVAPFAEDFYAREVTSDFSDSSHPAVQNALRFLPALTNQDLQVTWTWTETNGTYSVDLSLTNLCTAELESLSLQLLASSQWIVSTQSNVAANLHSRETAQPHFELTPDAGENVSGWNAFAVRIDYVSMGVPKTHYLFRDRRLPIAPAIAAAAIGPNCQIAGPLNDNSSTFERILKDAEGRWKALPYDPSIRPNQVNLSPGVSSTGEYAISCGILADSPKRGMLSIQKLTGLSSFRLWLNGNPLRGLNFRAMSRYELDLTNGVNCLVLACGAVGTESTHPQLTAEMNFYETNSVTPLSGISFTSSNGLPALPKISRIPDMTICRGQTVSFGLIAVDSTFPPRTLTYSLVPPAPTGATIDPAVGQFQWTPVATNVPSSNQITIRATDDGVPPLSTDTSFSINVLPGGALPSSNGPPCPPLISMIPDTTIDHGQTVSFGLLAIDSSFLPRTLTYSLVSPTPAGATIDPQTGWFQWTPAPMGVPYTNYVTIRVTDDGVPPSSTDTHFKVSVLPGISLVSTNDPPALPQFLPISEVTVHRGQPFGIGVTAVDSTFPPRTLTYSLVPPAPVGATIDPVTGIFRWTPTAADLPYSNCITVRATDDGVPPLSTDSSFTVNVVPGFWAVLAPGPTNGLLSLSWTTTSNSVYRVEFADDPVAPVWTPLAPTFRASGDMLSVPIEPALVRLRVFRVVETDQ